MKKTGMSLLLMLCLLGGTAACVHAETFHGDAKWKVAFTSEKKMESNFKTADLDEAIAGLQPGDNIIFTLKLANENTVNTDWYMTNEVLYSLEDRSANQKTKGGAYTYELTYTDKNGTKNTLFSSNTIGGDSVSRAGEGLHEATDALEDYFYLDTLAPDQSGKITLEIALDGETQGNDYQDTLADLQMNFAVELNNSLSSSDTPASRSRNRRSLSSSESGTSDPSVPAASVLSQTELVKTGDETNLVPYYIAMEISGGFLLFFAVYSLKQNKKEKEEKKGGNAT